MARKIDDAQIRADSAADDAAASIPLPYESDLLTSLLGIVQEWTSSSFLEEFARRSGIQLDSNAISAIYLLGRRGRLRPSELAHGLKMSAPTASKLIARLSDAGLVSRGANESDSRSSFVALTESGAHTAVTLFESGDLMMADLLADWSPRDVSALTRLIHRLAETVTAPNPSTPHATQHN
ncbi:MarR family winged helix-turn-helix transcriptional regulator [Leifsonia sp. A12D58]|uniref:MarR family winged helix-turn-helix transcriptional regulator n=1 Tax=Leifsonia sp. A12D58 TaxID=3397674 RepID=UPI0039E0B37A